MSRRHVATATQAAATKAEAAADALLVWLADPANEDRFASGGV